LAHRLGQLAGELGLQPLPFALERADPSLKRGLAGLGHFDIDGHSARMDIFWGDS